MSNSKNLPSKIEHIGERYLQSPVVRGLLSLLPGVSAADTALAAAVANMYQERQRVFFDELAKRTTPLSEEEIQKEPALHAFFATYKAAINTRQHEKIRLFASLYGTYLNGDVTEKADDYEEWLGVLDDLTYREFQILMILHRFEVEEGILPSSRRPHRNAELRNRWAEFLETVATETGIPKEDILGNLERLKRSGLYRGDVVGDLDAATGYLTPNFFKFIQALGETQA